MMPRIEFLEDKKLIGTRLKMSLANNKTTELWRDFMPRRNEMVDKINEDLISMQVYDERYKFDTFDAQASFEKWAAKEVSSFENVPIGMETFILEGGDYAVFEYKGLSTDTQIFSYIFGEWLQNSGFEIDQRPHFEVLGERYKNNDPNSEEEIWIPIKLKNEAGIN